MSNTPEYPNPSAQMIAEGGCEGKCETCEGKKICWKAASRVEQEKRERAIKVAMLELRTRCSMFSDKIDIGEAAAAFINAGYRKAEEVKMETVMEIVNWLDNNVYRIKNFREFIKSRFGVEVEE